MIKSNIKKVFKCDMETIWNIVTDNHNYSWRSDLSKIEVVDEQHFIEYTKENFATYFTIISKQKYKEYIFDMENKNIKGKWIGQFKNLSNGKVELDFTEEVQTSHFIMKIFAKLYLKSQQKKYFKDLENKINKLIIS